MKALLLFLAAALWLGALAYYGRRLAHGRVAGRVRAVLLGLRALSLFGIILLLFHPVRAREARLRRPLHLLFFLDDSASMAFPAGNGAATRLDQARKILFDDPAALVPRAVRGGFETRVLALSDQHSIASAAECSASAEKTDLVAALEWARGFGLDQDIAAVVLLTDGRHTETGDPVRAASGTPFPVFTIGFGSAEGVADLAVSHLSVPPSVPADEEFEAHAVVGIEGSVEGPARGEFLLDGTPVAAMEADIAPASRTVRFEAAIRAGRPGAHRVAFRVAPLEGEQVADNNERSRPLLVEKARFRVLVLAERPSWELKFLRRSIQESRRLRGTYLLPRGDGGSIVLRDAPLGGEPPAEPLSLFPGRAFSEWRDLLDESDEVVLQNVPADRLQPEWAEALAEWLAAAPRALVILGGDRSFGAGRYADSPLAFILPVVCSARDDRLVGEYGFRVPGSPSGLFPYRPFARFALDRVPPVLGLHRFQGIKPGADLLLEAVDPRGRALPALVVHRAGLGYVAAAGWDSLWRWRTLGKDPEILGRFWRTLLLFLLAGEDSGPAALSISDEGLRAGSPVRVWVYLSPTLLGEALPDRVELSLSGQSMNPRPVYLFPNPAEPNRYQGAFSLAAPGAYSPEYEIAGVRGTKTLWIQADSRERDYLSRDADILERLAAAGGGAAVPAAGAEEVLAAVPFEPKYQTTVHYAFLGRLPWVMVVLVGLLALEWIVRRWCMLP